MSDLLEKAEKGVADNVQILIQLHQCKIELNRQEVHKRLNHKCINSLKVTDNGFMRLHELPSFATVSAALLALPLKSLTTLSNAASCLRKKGLTTRVYMTWEPFQVIGAMHHSKNRHWNKDLKMQNMSTSHWLLLCKNIFTVHGLFNCTFRSLNVRWIHI